MLAEGGRKAKSGSSPAVQEPIETRSADIYSSLSFTGDKRMTQLRHCSFEEHNFLVTRGATTKSEGNPDDDNFQLGRAQE